MAAGVLGLGTGACSSSLVEVTLEQFKQFSFAAVAQLLQHSLPQLRRLEMVQARDVPAEVFNAAEEDYDDQVVVIEEHMLSDAAAAAGWQVAEVSFDWEYDTLTFTLVKG